MGPDLAMATPTPHLPISYAPHPSRDEGPRPRMLGWSQPGQVNSGLARIGGRLTARSSHPDSFWFAEAWECGQERVKAKTAAHRARHYGSWGNPHCRLPCLTTPPGKESGSGSGALGS